MGELLSLVVEWPPSHWVKMVEIESAAGPGQLRGFVFPLCCFWLIRRRAFVGAPRSGLIAAFFARQRNFSGCAHRFRRALLDPPRYIGWIISSRYSPAVIERAGPEMSVLPEGMDRAWDAEVIPNEVRRLVAREVIDRHDVLFVWASLG